MPPSMRASVLLCERNNNRTLSFLPSSAARRLAEPGPIRDLYAAGRLRRVSTNENRLAIRPNMTYVSFVSSISLLCDNFAGRLIHILLRYTAVDAYMYIGTAIGSIVRVLPAVARRPNRVATILRATLYAPTRKRNAFNTDAYLYRVLKFSNNASYSFISTFRSWLLALTVPCYTNVVSYIYNN